MVSGMSRGRTLRNYARILFGLFGVFQIGVYVSEGMTDHMLALVGLMFFGMAATNFCTQCPLFSAVKRMVGIGTPKRIDTDKV